MSWRSLLRNWAIGSTAIAGVSVVAPMITNAEATEAILPTAAVQPYPGMQGTDTSLPLTDSAVTVNGRGRFEDLEITVNQTRNLVNQAVSITWTGGSPTAPSQRSRFGEHFLQIMQCWGEDDNTNPDNAGPPPEQCVWGGVAGVPTELPNTLPATGALARVLGRTDWRSYVPGDGWVEPGRAEVWRPFRAVDGTVVNAHINWDFDPSEGGGYWLNPYFDSVTTNEIAGAYTYADGTGSEIMEITTGIQSSGLGCGQRVVRGADGTLEAPRCWLVIVPRGAAADEVVGTPSELFPAGSGVDTSPLAQLSWQNRIAIPLDFTPVDSPCTIGQDERRIVGSEIPLAAVTRWQPVLCSGEGLPPFAYAAVGDTLARQSLMSRTAGAPGMAVVSRPAAALPSDPIVYAPLTVSGLVIGVHVERQPRVGGPTDPMTPLQGIRVADLNLTPRLVAKLLTQSYYGQLRIRGEPPYDWIQQNPLSLASDPDFIRFNPEFELLGVLNWRTFGGLQLPAGNSDGALQVWEWVMADPEAFAWLEGTPDEWGMVVNPLYSVDPALNPNGVAFGTPIPSAFPKSDPYCYEPTTYSTVTPPPPLCGTDWMPYARSLEESARLTRSGNIRARIVEDTTQHDASRYWQREGPQTPGTRSVLSVTDSSSAARFGLQIARLSRAGDDGDLRDFVGPTEAGLAAGLLSMPESNVPGVVVPSPTELVPGAYPLTVVTYAAIAPLRLDQAARNDYASFIEYAVGRGQAQGYQRGELPLGYLPLLPTQRASALAAADAIRTLAPPPPTTTSAPEPEIATKPTDPSSTTTSTTSAATTTTRPAPPPINSTPPGINEPAPSLGQPAGRPAPGPSNSPTVATTTLQPPPPTSTQTPPPTTEAVAIDVDEPSGSSPPTVTTPTQESIPPALTPSTETGPSRLAVPMLGSAALFSALGALELTKAPRRRARGHDPLGHRDEGNSEA